MFRVAVLKAEVEGEDLIAARAKDRVADCIINDRNRKLKFSRSLGKNRRKDVEKYVKL